MSVTFHFKTCRVEVDDVARAVRTMFSDGKWTTSTPRQTPEDVARARALGYEGTDEQAVWSMTRDHDLTHALLAEAEGGESYVLRCVSAGEPIEDVDRAHLEECRVLLLQRVANRGLEP